MPLFFEKKDPAYSLALWKGEESVPDLCTLLGLSQEAVPARTVSRQREWLVTRLLMQHLFRGSEKSREASDKGVQLHGEIPLLSYDDMGKPHLAADLSVSISHTGNCVGVMVSPRLSCGLDLEHLHPRIEKIASRFLSDDERHVLDAGSLHALYVAWGAKEVLYKIYGKGNIIFREHLRVEPFRLGDSGSVSASIHRDKITRYYPVEYFFLDDLAVTMAVE